MDFETEFVEYLNKYKVLIISVTGEFDGPVDLPAMMQEVNPIIEQNSCNLLLFDYRKARIMDSTVDIYSVGDNADKLGFHPTHKVAGLYTHDEEKHRFIETVLINRGYTIKIFKNKSKALKWLAGK